jgi:NAD(P)-dependent dehydrogenase (short-subunit alcohol dehydrogenase family)
MRLSGKNVIITGGSRGIGRAAVELFAEEGGKVFNLDISLDEDFNHPNIEFIQHDVTDFDAWEKVTKEIFDTHGSIDILFNNAGSVGAYEGIEDIKMDDWHRVVNLNLNGVFYGARAVIPYMKKQGGGVMVHTSSMWGYVGATGVAAYTASKGAVRSFSKNVALTYAADGIRSNSLHPGIIATPMVLAQDKDLTQSIVDKTPIGRLGDPREVAYAALFLASDESSYITGTELVVDGGHTAQ